MGDFAAKGQVIMATKRPSSCRDLYWSFSVLALQGFGGVLAVVQRELVDKKQWLTREEFVEEWAVAQILPGPNVVNLALTIGDRYFGVRGALSAMAGMLSIPIVIVLTLVALFSSLADMQQVQGALRGMGAVSAGLITASGFKLMGALRHNPMGLTACVLFFALTFGAIVIGQIALEWVLLVLGLPAIGWTFVCLRAAGRQK